ncbi:MAG: hypothetical protein GY780_17415 [bacterium]|nr:hypothetical protein [bacterium]
MTEQKQQNPWNEVNGGLRGSTLLKGGAIVSVLATGQNFAAYYLGSTSHQFSSFLVSSAWLTWILALWLMAAGFIWVGLQPFFTRFGWFVGGFHFLNGLYLLVVLFAGFSAPLPGISISLGRTLLLLFFVILEKKGLKPWHRWFMVIITLLQFSKMTLRILDQLPQLGSYYDSAIDSFVLLLMSLGIFLVGNDLKKAENAWATDLASTRASGFDSFNNPEHQWNRE